MVVEVYREENDFNRELLESYITDNACINHKDKYIKILCDHSYKTILFDRIEGSNQHYAVYKKNKTLKQYNVFLYDSKQNKNSDCLLETDESKEAKYLCTALGLLCREKRILNENGEPYVSAEVYDNEAEDTIFERGM